MIIGIISDTHGLLRPEAVRALAGSDLILHAGDIGAPEVIKELAKLAPVSAIRGNADRGSWSKRYAPTAKLTLESVNLLMVHNRNELDKIPVDIDVLIFGHSHQPIIKRVGRTLFFNPGSAGPRRFRLPISLGRLRIKKNEVSAELVPLLP